MQAVIGTVIFALVCLSAIGVSIKETEGKDGFEKLIYIPSYFVGTVVACYVGMAIVGAILWVIAWIGILLREILQWLIATVLYPWHWLF